MRGKGGEMLGICAAVFFINVKEARVTRCCVQEKSTDGRVIDEMFGGVMEVSVVGGNPSRGMGFETVGKFIK